MFLSVPGERTYTLLRDLLAPVKLGEMSSSGVAGMLQKPYEPTRVLIADWFQFHKWNQAASESLIDYVTDFGN